jgi:hypothetical protein
MIASQQFSMMAMYLKESESAVGEEGDSRVESEEREEED